MAISLIVICISDSAREMLNKHGSYKTYIQQEVNKKRKEEKKIIFDRYIKNGNVIAALLISSLSLVLSQCPISSNKEMKKIEEGQQSLATELDSIKQALRNIPPHQAKPLMLDTATSK